ncbi:MAG: hypothetical protein ACKOPM_00695 [Novosphingobium sp.]
MAQTRRKGAMRYIALAIIPLSLAKGFEAVGDRAALEAGIGNGAGAPYYIAALLLMSIALGLFLFALKRLIGRIMGKDQGGAEPSEAGMPLLTPQRATRADEPFDPDAALQRYMQNSRASHRHPKRPHPARAALARRVFKSA